MRGTTSARFHAIIMYIVLFLILILLFLFRIIIYNIYLFMRHYNTGLVSSRVSLVSWGEGASLALVVHPSSDDITINIPKTNKTY